MNKKSLLHIIAAASILVIQTHEKADNSSTETIALSPYYHVRRPTTFKLPSISPQDVRNFAHHSFSDLYEVGREIFSLDSIRLLTFTAPFYLIARRADRPLHRKFYDCETHTNLRQPSDNVRRLLFDAVPIIPALAYSITGWVHADEHARRIAQIFSAGFLWSWSSKFLLKKLPITSCLRPLNAQFPQKEVHGGNPSGHTAIASYAATFFALTRGPKWGIPLSLGAAGVGTLGFIINRHYISQIVAGAALGIVTGFAAHRVTEQLIEPSSFELDINISGGGQMGLSLAYNF